MAHSPGDWRLTPSVLGAPIVETEQREIAKVLYHGGSEDPEVTDNARLITAAPKLLEAAEEAIALIEAGDDITEAQVRRVMGILNAAIAKAERGEKVG